MKRQLSIIIVLVLFGLQQQQASCHRRLVAPIVINTWNFTSANTRAWQELRLRHSAVDAIEFGCGQCEIDRCDGTVGWGGSPAENGETTLDAMIMDGENYNVGGVGGLRRIRNAIGVARQVLDRTNHSLLVGEMATQFAIQMGFKEQSLTSDESARIHQDWLGNSCQPNYWTNVEPDPRSNSDPTSRPALRRSNETVVGARKTHSNRRMIIRQSAARKQAPTTTPSEWSPSIPRAEWPRAPQPTA